MEVSEPAQKTATDESKDRDRVDQIAREAAEKNEQLLNARDDV